MRMPEIQAEALETAVKLAQSKLQKK